MAQVENMDFMDFVEQKTVDSGRIEGLEDADGLGYHISDESLPVESDEEVDGLVEYFEEESGEFLSFSCGTGPSLSFSCGTGPSLSFSCGTGPSLSFSV